MAAAAAQALADLRPILPQVIERYGPGGIVIGGVTFTGPVIILPDRSLVWPVAEYADITPENLAPIAEHGAVELLLLGTGQRMKLVPATVRDALRQIGIVVDGMDTGAACRTYNILVGERRRVAAALLPQRF